MNSKLENLHNEFNNNSPDTRLGSCHPHLPLKGAYSYMVIPQLYLEDVYTQTYLFIIKF